MEIDNVQAILDAAKKPDHLLLDTGVLRDGLRPVLYVPDGYRAEFPDLEPKLPSPLRKKGVIALDDVGSFLSYVKEHGQPETHIYLDADYNAGEVKFTAIINDHKATNISADNELNDGAAWRDHRAVFTPAKSVEWTRWQQGNGKAMDQLQFASFIEDNMADITTVQGLPTASQMLEMALNFEASSDKRFKSATRVQSGGIALEYIDTEDSATRAKMSMFDRFAIGIPVFAQPIAPEETDPENPAPLVAYRLDARLKYRIRDGELKLWYELVRPDKVLRQASQDLVQKIKTESAFPLLAGNPFAA